MSKMKDVWGDKIEFLTGFSEDTVEVVFHGLVEDDRQSMVFDQKKGRKFIDKFLRALEEVEDE